MDNMDEMDDVLRELENGKNPLGVPPETADNEMHYPQPKSAFRLRSLYVVPIALFLIAITAWIVGNNVVFSAIAVAAVVVGVLLLFALRLLWRML